MKTIKIVIANSENFGGKRNIQDIQYLVIHYTANDGDTAEANGKYFQRNIVKASAHYFVDDDSIIRSVADDYVAWSVGGKKYPSADANGGGKWYGKCTNSNSISVELCDTVKNGKYDFTEKTLENAADLCIFLTEKYNIPIENVIRHFDVVGKICPKPFVDDEKAWKEFKERLVEDMTKYYEELAEVPGWAKPMVQDMIEKGCFSDVNKLHLSDDMLRVMAVMDRYGKK